MPRQLHLTSRSVDDTRGIGAAVARVLRPGDLVALTGELGAGKTCFVQGAASALEVVEQVTSPTFLLRRDYHGRYDVLHLDVYRLDRLAEVSDLGYDEVVGGSHVVFVEWGDAMAPLLPADHLEVELRLPDEIPDSHGDEPRSVVIRAHGDTWARRLGALGPALAAWADGGGGG